MTSGLRQIYTVALAALALAACTSKVAPDMTPEESKRIGELTARMSPRCVGRYLVDLPVAFVLNNQSRTVIEKVEIAVRPSTRVRFDAMLATREAELSRKHMDGKPLRPFLKRIEQTPGLLGKVFNRAEQSGAAEFGRTLELLAWRDGFEVSLQLKATDGSDLELDPSVIGTAFEASSRRIFNKYKSVNDVPEKLAHLLDIYARLRGRNDDEIPKEQGVCFANGFLRGAPTDEERIDMYHHLDGVKDVYFTYHYFSHIGPEKTTLLQRGPAIEAGLSKVNGKTLRKGSREVNGLKFEEWLLRRESSAGAMLYDHTLELNSKEGNAAKPLFTLDLTSGVEHPGPQESLEEAATKKPIQKSTLSEAESIALWDKVTATLRPRPGAF